MIGQKKPTEQLSSKINTSEIWTKELGNLETTQQQAELHSLFSVSELVQVQKRSYGYIWSDIYVQQPWNCTFMKMSEPSPLGVCAAVSVLLHLLHSVQGTASVEPFYLGLIEGVVQQDRFLIPIGMLDDAFQGL